jgi:hypothetical protein
MAGRSTRSRDELLRVDVDGLERTLLASSDLAGDFRDVVIMDDGVAWMGQTGIFVVDRDGENGREWDAPAMSSLSFSPGGGTAAYVGIGPMVVDDSTSQRFAAQVNLLSTRDGAERVLHRCRAGCTSVFEDANHLLVRDGPDLLRVSVEGEVTRVMSDVSDVSFRSE